MILNMKKRKIQKLKRGFTLVELVTAIAIFAIFSAGAIGLILPISQIYADSITQSDARQLASNVLDTVENELTYAVPTSAGVVISPDGKTLSFTGQYGKTAITSQPSGGDAGYLYMARGTADAVYEPYYDIQYYRGGTVNISFAPGSRADEVITTVEVVSRKGELLFSTSGNLVPLAYL